MEDDQQDIPFMLRRFWEQYNQIPEPPPSPDLEPEVEEISDLDRYVEDTRRQYFPDRTYVRNAFIRRTFPAFTRRYEELRAEIHERGFRGGTRNYFRNLVENHGAARRQYREARREQRRVEIEEREALNTQADQDAHQVSMLMACGKRRGIANRLQGSHVDGEGDRAGH